MCDRDRVYSIDFMRLCLMVMIIIHHILLRGGGVRNLEQGWFVQSDLLYVLANSFFICAVDVFFIISGYFQIKFDFSKILKILFSVYVIYDSIYMCNLLNKNIGISYMDVKNLLMPITKFWFIYVYIVLSILSIYVNKVLKHLSDHDIACLLGIFFVLYCLYNFCINDKVMYVNNGYSLHYAIFLYVLGTFIRRTDFIRLNIKSAYIILFFSFSFVNSLFVYFCLVLENFSFAWHLFSYNNPLVLAAAISLFQFFRYVNCSFMSNYVFRKMSRYVLYVYIFHSSGPFFHEFIRWFLSVKSSNAIVGLFSIVFLSIIVLFIGIAIGYIFEKINMKLIGFICNKN